MKLKVAETTNIQLDWLVAKCEGFNAEALVQLVKKVPGKDYGCFLTKYSTDWAQGGPIIEQELIDLHSSSGGDWTAEKWEYEVTSGGGTNTHIAFGPTPLIAAMRCFVSSHLGDEVAVPKEIE